MIYTMYSFKGGVGRSMALANLGAYFCKKGLRVVMIDWDLEAPGLENYFYPGGDGEKIELDKAAARPGLIDLLCEYKRKFPELLVEFQLSRRQTSPDPMQQESTDKFLLPSMVSEDSSAFTEEAVKEAEEVARITREHRQRRRAAEKMVTDDRASFPSARPPLSFEDVLERAFPTIESYLQPIETTGSGGLWLLAAGTRTAETFGAYADSVQDFDWLDFIASFEGKAYLEWFRNKLSAFAQVVLIDSRTGVTEMGGICTRLMADVVVAFCAPNYQNVEGVARIVHSFKSQAAKNARLDRQLEVLVIPTRIDDSESALLGAFAALFSERFEHEELIPRQLEQLDHPLWNLQIPYIPKYNFSERLVISPSPPAKATARLDPPTEKLIKAYENIAVHLAVLAKESNPVRAALQSEIAGAFPYLLPHRTPHMTAAVPANWVERPELAAHLKQALLVCAKAPQGGRLAIWGQGGMGKSTLLARVCQDQEIVAAFPDGIIWLTLEGAWGSERVQDFLRAQFTLPRSGGPAALAHALEERSFLFVVDDVWTADQLDAVFAYGKRDSRVIITRDRATALQCASTVFTVGEFRDAQSMELLQTSLMRELASEPTLRKLLGWPLAASLLRAAFDRQSAQSGNPTAALNDLRAQLKTSGLRILDLPQATSRNGSLDLTLRDSLNRLQPEARRLLMTIVAAGDQGIPASAYLDHPPAVERRKQGSDRTPAQVLLDLGLAVLNGATLRAQDVVFGGLTAQSDLTGDSDEARRKQRKEILISGNAIVRGQSASLDEIERIAYGAKDQRAFSLARKLLTLARQHPDAASLPRSRSLKLLQQHALCTYKDDDTVIDERLSEAFQILNSGDLADANPSQETLGLAGSIYKQRWRYTGQRQDLEQSLNFYQRGCSGKLEGDFAYTRINAAFVLDLLGKLELQDLPESAQSRRRQAALLREEIAARLPDLASQPANAWLKGEWWYGATMTECLFGLGRYAEARSWLREALVLDPPAWQLEATARQMSALARAQDTDLNKDGEASRTVGMLVGDRVEALRAMTAGKVGLALSGGGFRASLFHIGVLARLAELDVLRHIEVLSCVSGGSIIGAHYYLEVRRLLMEKRDREITSQDYIALVKRIEHDFLAGVQTDIRGQLFADWRANARSLLFKGYTRTTYLGELLEKHIYSRVEDGGGNKRNLNELQIVPKDGGQDFNPKLDNWRRAAKAPILLLNATTLNTGHVWQFAVTWMGEPAISASNSIDSNDLLRRMYYEDAPLGYRNMRLGQAVAASACVPGLFDPVDLEELYPRRTVRLVDGGVHDNQGIAGLLEQECSVLLVSDASGQMSSERIPSAFPFSVLKRTLDISMSRIREAEFQELATLRRSSALNGLMFLHLKNDLDIKHVDSKNAPDPYDSSANPGKKRRGAILTTYGMPKNIQARIADLRTDLDTFSDAEAYALMLSGYRMTTHQFAQSLPEFPVSEPIREQWTFLGVEPTVDRATDFELENERLRAVLSTGARLSRKVWSLRPVASTMAFLGALVLLLISGALLAAVLVAVKPDLERLPPHTGLAISAVAALFLLFLLVQWLLGRKSLSVLVTGLVVVTVGWIPAKFHLWPFDALYRGAGVIKSRDTGGHAAR